MHIVDVTTEPTDSGYVWRCQTCGELGYGLYSNADAANERMRHVRETMLKGVST